MIVLLFCLTVLGRSKRDSFSLSSLSEEELAEEDAGEPAPVSAAESEAGAGDGGVTRLSIFGLSESMAGRQERAPLV